MYTNPSRKNEITNRSKNFENDRSRGMEDEFNSMDFYGTSSVTSYSKNERMPDSSFRGQPYVNEAFGNTVNERTSQSTTEWSSPYKKMKECWNYKAVLNDGEYPRIKISAKSKVKKSRSKRPRNDFSHSLNDNSSPHDNSLLRTRLKISSNSTSSRKKSSKQRKKFSVSLINNSFNGRSTSPPGPFNNNNNSVNALVPTYKNINYDLATDSSVQDNHYARGLDEVEYAPQYLELKPSVKFRCSRCGINDFSTMAILQDHMAGCVGQLVAPVTANSSLELSSPLQESRHPSVARNLKIKRKVLLCSSCGTYYQHYNLYVHMRDIHNKEICLFCRSTFSKAHQLWDHLTTIHNLNSVAYSNAIQIRDTFKNFFITCCSCNVVFSDQDEFGEHECKPHIDGKPEEPLRDVCQLASQPVSNDSFIGKSNVSGYENEPSSANTDDETESSMAHGVDEPITADSSLNVIGISNQSTVPSSDEEERTSEITEKLEMKKDENVSHSESTENDGVDSNMARFDEQMDHLLVPENQVSRPKSPFSSPFADSPRKECDDNVSPAAIQDQESEESFSWQQSNTTASETVPNVLECQKNDVPIEPVVNDHSPITKDEEETSNWLQSDDEIGNSIKAWNGNDAHADNEPSEPAPQPLAMALMLNETVASLSLETLLKECVRTSCDSCLYCNNAIMITVNGGQVASHLRSEHRYMPTKPEDTPEQVIMKIEEAMTNLDGMFLNASLAFKYTQFNDTFACLQCSFSTTSFKDLCQHKRKVHHKVIFLCIMCKCNFLYYSQLLCHLCPGLYSPEVQNTLNYHCCFCERDRIPSAFRLMVHLRKVHQACDICLTKHNDQSELFSHMIKQHKMNHLCYKCNLAYRSRDGINEHLFWKHGTESVLCKRCLQKKWPHAYHFCVPASTYTCEECSRIFTKAVALTVHRRAHTGVFPFSCADCDQRFISKKLLAVHEVDKHKPKLEPSNTSPITEDSKEMTVENEEAEIAENSKDGKKRRKKKQKKEKTDIEKPLLDDLPPLNLSSESDEDSAEEDVPKFSTTESRPEITDAKQSEDDEVEKVDNHDDNSTDSPFKIVSDSISADETSSRNTEEEIRPQDTEISQEAGDKVETLMGANPEKANPENTELSAENANTNPEAVADLTTEPSKTTDTSTILSSETEIRTPEATSPTTGNEESSVDTMVKDKNKSVSLENETVLPENESILPQNESVSPENDSEVFIERIRNCLIIEHSYCIPDSIFHSENPDPDVSLETIAQKLSPKLCSKSREKSSCKSVTPRKKKRPSKKESSSSDSCSDSDSSSSSCGSNCSCNQKSNSNCSSSSSGSEYSTTPDKKQSKNSTNETQADTTVTNDEDEAKREQDSLLNIRESDLDTDIQTSDEDFYDKYPTLVERVEDKLESTALPVLTMPPARPGPSLPKKEPTSSRKNRKRRRAPKLKIHVGSLNSETNLVNLQRRESPSLESIATYKQASFNDSRPGIHLCRTNSGPSYVSIPNDNFNQICVNKSSSKGNSSGRRSKRERFKNKFYGYSSGEEESMNDANKITISIKKRIPPKRPPKPASIKQPFIGIRAKKPLIMPPKRPPKTVSSNSTTMASAHPSLPPHFYRMPSYIMQQQQQQLQRQQQEFQRQYQRSSSSSDDSDSDNLIINEPSLNDRPVNNQPNFRFPIYPPTESPAWQRPSVSAPSLSTGGPSVPAKNDERLYCYCRCPYDEVSEMIGCDGKNCKIEWFHFECVGIMVPPKGAWYCPQCKNREAVPQFM